ncbi:2-oxo acid dehydrogenase subunit E2, partial [Patescibacteria group bacterium]|nr:2-oxo acid dehydrogenase subunit E2 [Patescibacteria group bacterium]
MAFEFKFPDVGEGITEGVLVKWFIKEGDEVRADDPVAEVETDKAVVELPSPKGGKVLKRLVQDGDQITVGQVILEIEPHEDDSPDTKNENSVGVVGDLPSDVTIIDEAPEPQHIEQAPPAPTTAS